ncbi:MAG: GerMN domain-containing protein [Christensenellales bacterium]|jgi:hypothetical protein
MKKGLFIANVVMVLLLICACAMDVPFTEGTKTAAREVLLYYPNAQGCVVPVAARGIVEGNMLDYLTYSEETAATLVPYGLRPALSQGADLQLSLSGGEAMVDIVGFSPASEREERGAVDSVVATLLSRGDIDSVRVLADGGEKTFFGTDISQVFTHYVPNAEQGIYSKTAQGVTLYFMDADTLQLVPVTRYTTQKPDVETAVLEFIAGPKQGLNLINGLPGEVYLLDIQQTDAGVALNFSKNFASIMEQEDVERGVLAALGMTCTQFDGVENISIMVEGMQYQPEAEQAVFFNTVYFTGGNNEDTSK